MTAAPINMINHPVGRSASKRRRPAALVALAGALALMAQVALAQAEPRWVTLRRLGES